MNFKGFLLILLLFYIAPTQLFSAEKLIISEFMAINSHVIQDEDKEFSDWIEIQNTDETTISLKGYYLTDNPLNLAKWKFPDVKLDAGKFLIVFASEKKPDGSGKNTPYQF